MNSEEARNTIVRLNASLKKAGLDWVVQEVSTVVERGIEERKEVAFESFDASDEPIQKRGRKTEVCIRFSSWRKTGKRFTSGIGLLLPRLTLLHLSLAVAAAVLRQSSAIQNSQEQPSPLRRPRRLASTTFSNTRLH